MSSGNAEAAILALVALWILTMMVMTGVLWTGWLRHRAAQQERERRRRADLSALAHWVKP